MASPSVTPTISDVNNLHGGSVDEHPAVLPGKKVRKVGARPAVLLNPQRLPGRNIGSCDGHSRVLPLGIYVPLSHR